MGRPASAIVISVLIAFLGTLAIKNLPVSRLPSVVPPTVVVAVAYPGASAELVDSVLNILQQAINGVQDVGTWPPPPPLAVRERSRSSSSRARTQTWRS